MKKESRAEQLSKVLDVLKGDARASLTQIAKLTGIPISTIFDIIRNEISRDYEFITVPKKKN